MKKKLIFPLVAVVLVAALCVVGFFVYQNGQPSAMATRVVKAMLTAPNGELYNPDATVSLGISPSTPEEIAKAKLLSEEVAKNWEAAVGDCFGDGFFKGFLNATPATTYLSFSEFAKQPISVKEIKLKKRKDNIEKLDITVLVSEAEQKLEMEFHYGTDGKIKTVSAPTKLKN